MKRNKRIAVTGGIGSGKSALINIFREKGYPVVSCDEVSDALWQDDAYTAQIARLFPACVRNGKPDKKLLSRLVFSNAEARARLNAFAHPYIMKRVVQEMAGELCFAEVPLLFEGGFENMFDGVIVVKRNLQSRITAVQARNGLTEEEVLCRIRSQFDYEHLDENKYIIVNNDGDMTQLEHTAQAVLQLIEG